MRRLGVNKLRVASVLAAAIAYGRVAVAADGGAPPPSRPAHGAAHAPAQPADASVASAPPADAGAPPESSPMAGADAGAQPAPRALSAKPARESKHASRTAPTRPPPTPEQVESLRVLKSAADAYELGARDYREAITSVVTLHYEQKKKAILAGLDNGVQAEKIARKAAREEAIARLEWFVAHYSGANASEEATPDAMYRLAALYEERARSSDDTPDDQADNGKVDEKAVDRKNEQLKPAIELYKRILREFPKYPSRAAVFFFLGHALNDSQRTAEAQQVWRSLVCYNHYPNYPKAVDPKSPEVDHVDPLPQDQDEAKWTQWRMRYTSPSQLKGAPPSEVKFQDPYPEDCAPIPQPTVAPGEDPPYIANTWWEIGNWEFDQYDTGGGYSPTDSFAVWDYNRAASAYHHSLQFKKPPLYGVVLYKYAWTLYKQQRYRAATEQFISLLLYIDEQQRLTGDTGLEFRNEAYMFTAGALMNADFDGPPADEPYIVREDILAKDPKEAEKALRVAFNLVQDAAIIPQDKPWTIEIYRALAVEYRTVDHFQSALAVYQKMLEKWPTDPTAPDTQNAIAETYDLLAKSTRAEFRAERQGYESEVLKARTALSKYTGDSPWVDANKDNPAALARAEALVKTGLKSAAGTHTNNGLRLLDEADKTTNRADQLSDLNQALGEFRLAAQAWDGYLKQDENAPDAYKSRYFRADALHQQVAIAMLLHKASPAQNPEPATDEIEQAKAAAIEVRDSDEDDAYVDIAAFIVVDLADMARDLAYQKHDDSGGTQGVELRKEPRFEGTDAEKKVVADGIPDVVQASMSARDDYLQRVPAEKDKEGNASAYAFYAGDVYYAYGHFKEARERLEPLYRDHCSKDKFGYEAWKRLLKMSNFEKDTERSRVLAEAEKEHSCALSDLQKVDSKMLVDPTIQGVAYLDARRKFSEAEKAKDGPGRDALWKEAGRLYEAALVAAPGRDEAPEAAMNAAYAYKQISQFNDAIRLYNKFIEAFGSDENLNRLEKGGVDPNDAKAKVAPDPAKYKTRLKYLADAYDALSGAYYGFFNYPQAAQTYAKVAANRRFDEARRQDAARTAMKLYAKLGDRANMLSEYAILVDPALRLPPERRAEADFLRASFDYAQWNPDASDSGANGNQRRQAIASFEQFHAANKGRPEAARYVVESAYKIGKMLKSAGDPTFRAWFKTTIADWQYFGAHPFESTQADGSKVAVRAADVPYNGYAAEADFTLLDETIHAEFDYDTGHHHYAGNVADVVKNVEADLVAARDKYGPRLLEIVNTYGAYEWQVAAIARLGTIYDAIGRGLDAADPRFFTPQQEAVLKKLEDAGEMEAADQARSKVDEDWRKKKDEIMDQIYLRTISNFVGAAMSARSKNVRSPAVRQAIARLAVLTGYVGDDKMRAYAEQVEDPTDSNPDVSARRKVSYQPGMFLQWRSGLVAAPPVSGLPLPGPVAP